MDELVKTIDDLDLERIKFHAQKIGRLCSKRSVDMLKPRKEKESKRKKNKWMKKKDMKKCDRGNKILRNKHQNRKGRKMVS